MKIMLKGLIAASMLVAGAAQAAPPTSRSVMYFDEAGHYVGQQYLLCDGRAGHGGNIHTAYSVTEAVKCSSPSSDPGWIVADTIVTAYTLPGSLPIGTACTRIDCGFPGQPEVDIDNGGWTYSLGWQ